MSFDIQSLEKWARRITLQDAATVTRCGWEGSETYLFFTKTKLVCAAVHGPGLDDPHASCWYGRLRVQKSTLSNSLFLTWQLYTYFYTFIPRLCAHTQGIMYIWCVCVCVRERKGARSTLPLYTCPGVYISVYVYVCVCVYDCDSASYQRVCRIWGCKKK